MADGPDNDVDVFALVQLARREHWRFLEREGYECDVAGTVNPESIEAHYFFEYGTTPSYGLKSAEEASSAATSQPAAANLTGLEPNTTYHYRLVAINANGTSRGQDGKFTTGPVIAEVSTGPASNVGITTATLNGQLNPEEGVETNYYFQYGTTIEYGAPAKWKSAASKG